jgi:Protein of unknown function (DUF3800)
MPSESCVLVRTDGGLYSPLKHLVHSIWGYWSGGRKLMAFYTGYFDESGHEAADIFVIGGLVLDVEDPSIFESEWRTAISPLTFLHTADFIGGHGKFEKWNYLGLDGKRALLERAAQVIAKHSFQTFSVSLDMDAYKRINDERIFAEAIGKPYSLCARFASVQMRHWSQPNSIPERVKLVFEKRQGFQGEIASVFERDNLDVPAFEGKEVLPLQAADLIAWLYQGKITKSKRFDQMKSVYRQLPRILHTHDSLGYRKLLEISQRVPRNIVHTRAERDAPVVFHSDPKRVRSRKLT